jgi:hypothetical protein
MSGMGCPQLGFPRLRVAAGRATGIAIGPDHTPAWGDPAAEFSHGWHMVCGSGCDGMACAADEGGARFPEVSDDTDKFAEMRAPSGQM